MKQLMLSAMLCGCLAACSSLQFESLPTGKLEACDTRLVGDWKQVPDAGSEEKPGLARLSANCAELISLDLDSKEIEVDPLEMQFLRVKSGDYLVEVPDTKEPVVTVRPPGYTLVRYQVNPAGNALQVWRGNAELGARLVGEGKLPGLVDRRTRGKKGGTESLLVHVYGESSEVDEVLRAHSLFSGKTDLELKRASAGESRQLDKAWAKYQREHPAAAAEQNP